MSLRGPIDGRTVDLGQLSRQTRQALAAYSSRRGLDEWLGDRGWVESHWAAWLVELLKAEKDDPALFPKGQWATIQVIQSMVEAAAKLAVEREP